MIINSHNVDTRFATKVAPMLFYNSWLEEGRSFNGEYMKNGAGEICIHDVTVGSVYPATPGNDFTLSAGADSLITTKFVNNFQKTAKLYGVVTEGIEANIVEAQSEGIMGSIRESRELAVLGYLANTASLSSDSTTLTTSNVIGKILADDTAVRKAKVNPDVLLCSPNVWNLLKEAAGSKFIGATGEDIWKNGNLAYWNGYAVYCVNAFGHSDSGVGAKYVSNAATPALTTIADTGSTASTRYLNKMDYILYDHRLLSVLDQFTSFKVVDGGLHFTGTAIVGEVCTAIKYLKESTTNAYIVHQS